MIYEVKGVRALDGYYKTKILSFLKLYFLKCPAG